MATEHPKPAKDKAAAAEAAALGAAVGHGAGTAMRPKVRSKPRSSNLLTALVVIALTFGTLAIMIVFGK